MGGDNHTPGLRPPTNIRESQGPNSRNGRFWAGAKTLRLSLTAWKQVDRDDPSSLQVHPPNTCSPSQNGDHAGTRKTGRIEEMEDPGKGTQVW